MSANQLEVDRIERFKLDLSNANWNNITMENPNDSFNLFHANVLQIHENNFPLVKTKPNKKLKSWMTDGVTNSIRYKNKLYQKYLNCPTNNNFVKYKNFCNKLNTIIRITKANFYKDKFENEKNNART